MFGSMIGALRRCVVYGYGYGYEVGVVGLNGVGWGGKIGAEGVGGEGERRYLMRKEKGEA